MALKIVSKEQKGVHEWEAAPALVSPLYRRPIHMRVRVLKEIYIYWISMMGTPAPTQSEILLVWESFGPWAEVDGHDNKDFGPASYNDPTICSF